MERNPKLFCGDQDSGGTTTDVTLRDLAAMFAMAGVLMNPVIAHMTVEVLAKDAYRYADALLDAREHEGNAREKA